jgi:hypothetical protein
MSKLAQLQNALNSASGRQQPKVAAEPTPHESAEPTTYKAPSRAGHVNMAAWLPKEFKKSIRLVQAKKLENASIQDLMAEALNDLFSKYNVPTVNYPTE